METCEEEMEAVFISSHTGNLVLDKNTIHIRFAGENGESNQLVEFKKSSGYEEHVFELKKGRGQAADYKTGAILL